MESVWSSKPTYFGSQYHLVAPKGYIQEGRTHKSTTNESEAVQFLEHIHSQLSVPVICGVRAVSYTLNRHPYKIHEHSPSVQD